MSKQQRKWSHFCNPRCAAQSTGCDPQQQDWQELGKEASMAEWESRVWWGWGLKSTGILGRKPHLEGMDTGVCTSRPTAKSVRDSGMLKSCSILLPAQRGQMCGSRALSGHGAIRGACRQNASISWHGEWFLASGTAVHKRRIYEQIRKFASLPQH